MPTSDARARMVEQQLVARGIREGRVLDAMRRVPRDRFVDPEQVQHAYEDRPLSIGHGQTISQPYVVARMCELAQVRGSDRILEVGAGSGYQAAVLAELARSVYAVEIIPELAERANRTLASLGVKNVVIDCRDGTSGWPEHAPYDAILVAAGSPRIPVLLLDQLADGGRLVIPVGPREDQRLVVVTRRGAEFDTQADSPVRFVDLRGRYGWGGSDPPRA